jgi:hypothetical protein
MKQIFNNSIRRKKFQQLFISVTLLLWILVISSGSLFAQPDSTKKEVQAERDDSTLISPSLEFISVQKGDNTIDLKAALKTKIKTSSIKLPMLKVSFLLVTDAGEKSLGFVITDLNGKALLNIKADSLATDKEGKIHLKAIFAGNKKMEPAEGEVTIKRARLEMTPVKEDSLLSVNVKLVDLANGKETPVSKTDLGIFVKRMFFPLKVGEGTTDDSGEANIEVPLDLPGDSKGDITLIAKLDENELYGNLETSIVQKWGTPVSDKLENLPRALWSAHPPVWMMVTFIILMSTVWGHYLVIIIQLFRLRKEEPEPDSPTNEAIYQS